METAVTFDASGLGLPVEIGRIDKELGKLWDSSDDTKTRASLINFVTRAIRPRLQKTPRSFPPSLRSMLAERF
jgi:hypothetical protein